MFPKWDALSNGYISRLYVIYAFDVVIHTVCMLMHHYQDKYNLQEYNQNIAWYDIGSPPWNTTDRSREWVRVKQVKRNLFTEKHIS